MFLWHYPSAHADQSLTGTLPYGARTFLEQLLAAIARDCPVYFLYILLMIAVRCFRFATKNYNPYAQKLV
jgi:hypothetical protein